MIEQHPHARARRDDLTGVPRALSDVLDEYLMRERGVVTSHNGWDLLLSLLHDEGFDVVDRRNDPLWVDYQELDGWYTEAHRVLGAVARRLGYDVAVDPTDKEWDPAEVRSLMARWAAT